MGKRILLEMAVVYKKMKIHLLRYLVDKHLHICFAKCKIEIQRLAMD